jgi:hypothetical protein
MTSRFQPLDRLPLFASEDEVARALLGPGKVAEWRQIAPLLEKRGFPSIDGGRRYTPAIRAFFDRDYKVKGDGPVASAPHAPAELGA